MVSVVAIALTVPILSISSSILLKSVSVCIVFDELKFSIVSAIFCKASAEADADV